MRCTDAVIPTHSIPHQEWLHSERHPDRFTRQDKGYSQRPQFATLLLCVTVFFRKTIRKVLKTRRMLFLNPRDPLHGFQIFDGFCRVSEDLETDEPLPNRSGCLGFQMASHWPPIKIPLREFTSSPGNTSLGCASSGWVNATQRRNVRTWI